MRTFTLLGLLLILGRAQAQKPGEWNQRRINEYAAMLDHAVYKIIAEPGTRLNNEPLPPYLARLFAPAPKETPPRYQARIQGYLNLLSQLGKAIAPLHKVPPLQEVSDVNKQRWREITTNSAIVSMKGDKLLGMWRDYLKGANNPQLQSQNRQALAKETLTTLYYILRIRKDIAVARP